MAESIFDLPPEYVDAEARRALPRMLMEGTSAFRRDSTKWDPPYNADENIKPAGGGTSLYEDRISNTIVEPFFCDAVKRESATILGKAIVLGDDVPPVIRKQTDGGEGWVENVDLRGNNIDVFFREVVKDAAGEGGFSTVLADHSPRPAANATDADLQAAGLRPFLRHYAAKDVILALPEFVNGRRRVGYLRLADTGDKGQPQRREIWPAPVDAQGQYLPGAVVTWRLWEQVKGADNQMTDVEVGRGTMAPHLDIPIRVVYFNACGSMFFEGMSPFYHLAEMNLLHTKNQGRLNSDLLFSMGGTLFRHGITEAESKQVALGPRSLMWDDKGTAEWLTSPTDAFEPMQKQQDRLEDKMRAASMLPSIGRTGNVTATNDAIADSTAKTETEAQQLVTKDFIEGCLADLAAYRGIESGGSVTLPKPAKYVARDDAGFASLLDMHERLGAPTLPTLLSVAVAQGIGGLPDDLDVNAEAKAAEAQQSKTRAAVAALAGTAPSSEVAATGGAAKPEDAAVAVAGQDVQVAPAFVLNGAQITAATAIVVAVSKGDIPLDAGQGQLEVLFNLSTEQAKKILGSAGTSTPTTPNPKPAEAGDVGIAATAGNGAGGVQ